MYHICAKYPINAGSTLSSMNFSQFILAEQLSQWIQITLLIFQWFKP